MESEHAIHTFLIWIAACGLAALNGAIIYGLMTLVERRKVRACWVPQWHRNEPCTRGTTGCIVDHGGPHG